MGFFSNLFGKKNCSFCGNECGAIKRTKLRDKEYVCSDCKQICSSFVRVSEFDKPGLGEHMEYMKLQAKMCADNLESAKKTTYPGVGNEDRIIFYDSLGVFQIRGRDIKNTNELFRYDQVASYEPYIKYGTPPEGKTEKPFQEYGVKITLLQPKDLSGIESQKYVGRKAHPYIKKPIEICFSKKESDYKRADYSDNCIAHFEKIFGVHDSATALFSLKGSKEQQRKGEALKDMASLMGTVAKAAVSGTDSIDMDEAKEKFEKANASADALKTHGLSEYSNKADEMEARAKA